MYARNLSMKLKPSAGPEFTRTLENDVLPVLRKQNGFKDELTFVTTDGKEAIAISLWDRKESADAYGRDAYAGVLKSMSNVVQGTPELESYDVSNSTFHKIAAKS
jgi:hypothetical protein